MENIEVILAAMVPLTVIAVLVTILYKMRAHRVFEQVTAE